MILLPVIFLLGIFFKISSSGPLQANDTAKQEQTNEKKPVVDVETKEVDGKTIMVVPTEKTDKKISQLNKENYEPNESLITPVVALSENLSGSSKETKRSTKTGDVQIPKANVKVIDGAATFDSDNNPGHDKDGSNNIVRSFDQISYLLDFSVQNMNVDRTYTNIKYRVTAKLPDAITLMADGTTPQVNAEIANGKSYHPDGTPMTNDDIGHGYSEGIVESSISNTGQVFIPVVVNVFGAPHGQQLEPQIEVTILSAERKKDDGTIETIMIDETYDETDFSSLGPAATSVSSKPNIMVQLQQGKIQNSSKVFDKNPSTILSDTYNIGVVTTLKPLDEHAEFSNPYVGVCYPKGTISYSFSSAGSYSGSTTSGNLTPGVSMTKPGIGAYAPATLNRTASFTDNLNEGLNLSSLSTLHVPNANTEKIFMTAPTTDLNEKGVYYSGDFTASKAGSVTNSDYIPVQSNYIYDMVGNAVKKDWATAFSSLELLMYWNRTTTENFLGSSFDGVYGIDLSVESVTFDGITVDNTKGNAAYKVSYSSPKRPTGGGSGGVSFYGRNPPADPNTNTFKLGNQTVVTSGTGYYSASPDTDYAGENTGNEILNVEDKNVYFSSYIQEPRPSFHDFTTIDQILMWDPSAFQYDESRYFYVGNRNAVIGENITFKYGVAKTADTPWKTGTTKQSIPAQYGKPATTAVVAQVKSYDETYNDQFAWFDTPNQARTYAMANSTHAGIGGKYGDSDGISAVRIHYEFSHIGTNSGNVTSQAVPVKVIQKTGGVVSPAGNTLAGLTVKKMYNPETGKKIEPGIDTPSNVAQYNNGKYLITNYNSDGTAPIAQRPMQLWNWIGTSAFIRPFYIKTDTNVINAQYITDQDIDIKVKGYLEGADSSSYDTAFNTTLPKGISYKNDSSVDAQGNSLPNPTITENPDGTSTLRWVFPKSDFDQGTEVNFKATSDISKLNFDDTGLTSNLTVNTVGEMWITGSPDNKDNSSEKSRSSSDSFREKLDQQLILTKEIDKEVIEVGTNDPADSDSTSSTDFNYTVTGENNSIQDLPTLKLLDVLPYNGDSRKTSFNGSYSVQSVKVTLVDSKGKTLPAPASSKLYFTTTTPSAGTYDEKTDPNKITGWTEATSSVPVSASTKGLLVEAKNIPTGGKIILKLSLRPNGKQLAGDVYRNNARMNSVIDNPVTSQVVETKVYGRDLTGYVWYDDDYNGLIDPAEAPVGNIPVKLYRTSYKNGSYTNELVEKSLTGEAFIDGSGDSLIKTGTDGNYTFNNLPEGEYIARFMVDDIVTTQKIAIVTKKLEGIDSKLNSKADPTTFKTDDYDLPVVEDLPGKVVSGEYIHHTKDVNAGLTPLSKIRIFKYEEGSVIDVNGDGTLEPEEIEASTTNALEGAEFQLYKGKKDDPDTVKDENKIGPIHVTDKNGWLEFVSLPPGDYTIVETKAPSGFELLKEPIEVHVPTYNYIAIVHVPDKGHTKLPFTGSTKAMRIILIVAACLLVIGMTGVFLHFRPIKVRGGN
ncbi:SpaA isopeptide-forming pilin-related protein [Enterococcus sp. DIV0756]|uniref:SpaA isopeptide-forming pilin-related protein n=1 Tax=Enterococcus sp. DIV0756 TaxID=2774636 RepID=UPI003F2091E6